jgi:hypothetical protein
MHISFRLSRRTAILLALTASLAVSAFASATASASQWVQSEASISIKSPSGITVTQGGESVTCNVPGKYGYWSTAQEGWAWPKGTGEWLRGRMLCEGETDLEHDVYVTASGEGEPGEFGINFGNAHEGCCPTPDSPFGEYFAVSSVGGTWINGTALTPSTITFEEVQIGWDTVTNEEIFMDGTFTATQLNGSLLSLES